MSENMQVVISVDDNPYSPPKADVKAHRIQRLKRGCWFRGPYRLLIIHTALILFFMFALLLGWTDFLSPMPYDCFYPPYLFISGPLVYFVAHDIQHAFDPLVSPGDVKSIRVAWSLIPGSVCLILGGVQWWLIELVYFRIRRRSSEATGTGQV
jgi:hypothetical protein